MSECRQVFLPPAFALCGFKIDNNVRRRNIEMAAKVNKQKCTGCESCVPVCPTEAISINDGKAKVEAAECICCETCIDECSVGALAME